MQDELTEKIIGAAIEVHRELGPGLLESIYEEALCYEFELQGIKYQRQAPADIIYKGKVIKGQKIDLLVEDEVVVEIKSLSKNTGSCLGPNSFLFKGDKPQKRPYNELRRKEID
jgi:GxxExxY protein